jgi:exonuclease VII large subunit
MNRGYAVATKDGHLITSVEQVNPLDQVKIRLSDGELVTMVNEILPFEK